jgi:phage protein D
MTLEKLQKLAEQKKAQVMKEFKLKGYAENMGVKQLRAVEDAAMSLAHNHSANWNERQAAHSVVISFNNWLDNI